MDHSEHNFYENNMAHNSLTYLLVILVLQTGHFASFCLVPSRSFCMQNLVKTKTHSQLHKQNNNPNEQSAQSVMYSRGNPNMKMLVMLRYPTVHNN